MSRDSMPPQNEDALDVWREKLMFLLKEEAIEADPQVLWNVKCRIGEARAKITELGGDIKDVAAKEDPDSAPTIEKLFGRGRLMMIIMSVAVLLVLLGVLGQMTHRSRATMLRLLSPLTYPSTTLVKTGVEAVSSIAVNGLMSPLSSRPEVRVSAWVLLALASLCFATFRWHGRRVWLAYTAMAFALVVLWIGIHFYTFALRARHGVEEPGDTEALCSNYFVHQLGKAATLSEQIVVESCSWLAHPTATNVEWRQSLSGLVVFFLLASGVVLWGGVRLGRREGWRESVRRLLLGTHVVVLLIILRQVPLANAYDRWGLDYPVDQEDTGCCRYDVSEDAAEPAFLLWGPACPQRRESRGGERPALPGKRRTISAECAGG